MSDNIYPIEDLAALYARRDQAEQTLMEVRRLLERADKRRAADAGNRRHWNGVIDQLERSLDEARFRFEQSQKAVEECERDLSPEEIAHAASLAEGASEEPESTPPPALSEDPAQAAREVMAMSIDDLRNLTMEQVAVLHTRLPKNANPEAENAGTVESRIELANQLRKPTPPPGTPSKLMERRNQLLLRRTLHKAWANRLSDITREERDLLQGSYHLLCRRIDPSPQEERLRVVVETALRKLQML